MKEIEAIEKQIKDLGNDTYPLYKSNVKNLYRIENKPSKEPSDDTNELLHIIRSINKIFHNKINIKNDNPLIKQLLVWNTTANLDTPNPDFWSTLNFSQINVSLISEIKKIQDLEYDNINKIYNLKTVLEEKKATKVKELTELYQIHKGLN